ncbi:hypothetical protein J2X46_003422 [Nocardioides sp. BE266]|uniref:hypothetical protein n=1 Tax=Nocardioides sp. BE266 TaxID=2817725 RepID=UPI002866655E|nr:hypothetical protein [Nocardioides sp. BE266]MDR7254429.1 hypothetical protein [Nocardioides sp. BE266]
MRLRSTLVTVGAAALLSALAVAPAHADGVQTLTGPATGDAAVYLTYVDCTSLFSPGTAPASRLNLGPFAAPMGRRSLGLVPAGGGTASGPVVWFDSLASVGSSFSVASTGGSTGASYVLVITPDAPAGAAWLGRTTLSVPSGGWQQVSASALTYDWSLVDLTSHAPLGPGGTATPAEFAAAHGDGKGLVVSGFGCDGGAFNLDAVQGGDSTFDFEGIALTTSLTVDGQKADAGDTVTITGRVTDARSRVTGDPLVLESRAPGGAWKAVGGPALAGADGLVHVDVPVTETTEFRWHRPESQYADEGWSDAVTVTVAPTVEPTTPTEK